MKYQNLWKVLRAPLYTQHTVQGKCCQITKIGILRIALKCSLINLILFLERDFKLWDSYLFRVLSESFPP